MKSPLKSVVIALSASVMLNLFTIGFLAAHWLRRPSGHFDDLHGPGFRHFGMAPGMRGPGHEVFHGLMQRHGEELRATREQLRDARRAVRDALTSEPFDHDALQHSLERLQTTTAASQHLIHSMILETAPTLSPEQRGQLARAARMLGDALNGSERERIRDRDRP